MTIDLVIVYELFREYIFPDFPGKDIFALCLAKDTLPGVFIDWHLYQTLRKEAIAAARKKGKPKKSNKRTVR